MTRGLRDVAPTASLVRGRDLLGVALADQLGNVAQVARVTRSTEDDLRDGRVPDGLGLFVAPAVAGLRQGLQHRDRRDAGTAALAH